MSTSTEARRIRAAKNQSLYREVNERLEELRPPGKRLDFVCECILDDCEEQLPLSVDEYEAVRRDATQFAVKPGHWVPEVERVVAENERFVVVAKIGAGSRTAERFDPRSRGSARTPGSDLAR